MNKKITMTLAMLIILLVTMFSTACSPQTKVVNEFNIEHLSVEHLSVEDESMSVNFNIEQFYKLNNAENRRDYVDEIYFFSPHEQEQGYFHWLLNQDEVATTDGSVFSPSEIDDFFVIELYERRITTTAASFIALQIFENSTVRLEDYAEINQPMLGETTEFNYITELTPNVFFSDFVLEDDGLRIESGALFGPDLFLKDLEVNTNGLSSLNRIVDGADTYDSANNPHYSTLALRLKINPKYTFQFMHVFPMFACIRDSDFRANFALSSFEIETSIPLPPDPVKDGHTFIGWFYDEELTIPYAGEKITGTTHLYAGWSINKYTISFDVAGGFALDSILAEFKTIPELPIPERIGHTFKGWLLNGQPYTGEPVVGNVALIADWEIIIYEVTFIVDGEEYVVVEVPYGGSLIDVANKHNLDVTMIFDDNSIVNFAVFGDSIVGAAVKTSDEIFKNKAVRNLTTIAGGIVGIALLACLIPSGKRKKKYN